jgi:hypothetical protein
MYDHSEGVLLYDDNNENLVQKLPDEDRLFFVFEFDILWMIVYDGHLSTIFTSSVLFSYCAIASYSLLS